MVTLLLTGMNGSETTMAKRITRNFLANEANRHQLKAYLHKLNVETYREDSDNDLRETAVAYFEQTLAAETPELQQYGMQP